MPGSQETAVPFPLRWQSINPALRKSPGHARDWLHFPERCRKCRPSPTPLPARKADPEGSPWVARSLAELNAQAVNAAPMITMFTREAPYTVNM